MTGTATPLGYGLFIGPSAGAAILANPIPISYGVVGIGGGACQSLYIGVSEDMCLGPLSGQYLVSGQYDTFTGIHSGGFLVSASATTGTGNDTFRDMDECGGCSAHGAQSQDDGSSPGPNTSSGTFALHGNAGSIVVAGSPAIGGTYSIPFTTTNGNVTGLPASATFTTTTTSATDLAVGLATAIQALNVANSVQPGGGTTMQAIAAGYPGGSVLAMHFPGGNATGWAITPGSPTCTGTCSGVTFTVNPAFSGVHDHAFGYDALYSQALTTGSYDDAEGDFALFYLSGSSSGCQAYGGNAGMNTLTCSNSIIMGLNVAENASALSNDIILSPGSAQAYTTGTLNTILSIPNGGTYPTTGSGETMFGYGCNLPAGATVNWQLCLANYIYGNGNNIGGGGSTWGTLGIGGDTSNGAVLGILGPDTSASTIVFRARNSTPSSVIAAYDNSDVVLGLGANLAALNASGGFAYLPFTNATSGSGGIPTGTPTNSAKGPGCVWNDVTFVLDCYSPGAGAWKHVAFSANAG